MATTEGSDVTDTSTIRKYAQRPTIVRAMQWFGGDTRLLAKLVDDDTAWGRADAHDVAWPYRDDGEQIVVYNFMDSLWVPLPVGHWLIKGDGGLLHACRPDVFNESYREIKGPIF
jgi:hypothetical protein